MEIPRLLNLYKPVGETPLQTLDRFRVGRREYADIKLSYVGRLDPMASGVLLVLVGEENKVREKYLSLDKEYEVDILFGVTTDTFDTLGLITGTSEVLLDERVLRDTLGSLSGKLVQLYPPYSSKTVLGKPLFQYTREGKLGEIDLPKREIEIKKIKICTVEEKSLKDVVSTIISQIKKVEGDFRQVETINSWNRYLETHQNKSANIVTMRVACSSGTYIRRLVDDIGKKMNISAMVLRLTRHRVGNHLIIDSLQ